MIAYDLRCMKGHFFEGWFEDEKAYLSQKKKGLVTCPVCDDTTVSRVPSTFAIKSSPTLPKPGSSGSQLAAFSRQIVDYVQKNFDDVGCDFATEALKIHYGVKDPRNIRGTSTEEEEKTLKDEGIQFLKIPIPATSETDS